MDAFTEELNSHAVKGTWDRPCLPPKGKKVIPGRWVMRLKFDSMGAIARHKARWVAKGFRQIEGIDFNEIYAGVIKSMSWRILLALGAMYDYEIEHSDVVTAFLESLLKEEVWIEQPHAFTDGNQSHACRLRRALYGLKQSAHEWYETLRAFLEFIGFTRLENDHCVFVNEDGVIVAVYVDDILYLARIKAQIKAVKDKFDLRFRMKHLGDISWYLGMAVIRDRPNRTIFINQASYSRQLVSQLDMIDCHPTKTPMDNGSTLQAPPEDHHANKEDAEAYRSLIGALQWLVTMTRSDMAYAVGRCGRYTNNPGAEHFNAAKRITKYLAASLDLGIRYGPHDSHSGDLIGWTDSAWADCLDSSRATSGWLFQLWNGPISWQSKRQTLCTDSTAEAEYVAQANAAKEAIFLAALLHGMGYEGEDAAVVKLMADNQSAIKLATNPVNHSRTKHIRNKYHLVRQLVTETKELKVVYVNTKDMVADGLTKPLPVQEFQAFVSMLGLAMSPIG